MNYISFTPKQKIELYELNNMISNRKTQESYANRGKFWAQSGENTSAE